jgi:Tfp pilus assembly protein PilF
MKDQIDEAGRLFHAGLELMAKSDRAGAENAFRRVLQLQPGLAAAHSNLGLLLEGAGRPEAAEACYRRALELNPGLVQTGINFGALLAARQRYAEAEAIYRRALGLAPEHPGVLSNLGVLLAELKREAEAEHCYRAALAAAPEHRSAAFNLGSLLLRQGYYEEGWRRLESRRWHSPLQDFVDRFPRWQGEPVQGKSLLIAVEGGHGDMIQFCRYAALLKQRGAARVTVFCHPGLCRLFRRLRGVDEVLTSGSPPPPAGWDFWTLPLSLPHLLGTTLDTIPAHLPYLTAEPEAIAAWRSALGKPWPDLGVGLVWQGNPRFERNADRSLPSLSMLAPLSEVPGIRFFSLQKDTGAAGPAVPGALPLVELGPQLGDFAETAAVIMNLDLVITVDTAVAHLAGALGKPCWVLLSDYWQEWRWLEERPDSPWYPGVMRLFRQKIPGDWGPVIADVKTALGYFAEVRRTTDHSPQF